MRVRIARSIRQPVLYSYFLSHFSDAVFDLLAKSKPFAFYHKKMLEYEVTPEVYSKVLKLEDPEEIVDCRTELPLYVRRHTEEYGYQQDAVEFARKTDNIFVNFPQGMGKSLTTLKIILDRGLQRTLIVCGQSNLQEEWLKDATKHGLKAQLDMHIVGEDSGCSSSKKLAWLAQRIELNSFGVDLINIEALRNAEIVGALNKRCYDCIVVDEVQSAKGWKADQTQGLHDVTRYAGQVRIALSGTPVLNSPLEFYSLLKYFGILKDTSRTTFEKYYGVWTFDYWGHYVCTDTKNLADLMELVKCVICYAPKTELNLPPKRRKKIDLSWQSKPEHFAYLEKLYNMPIARLKKHGYSSKPAVRAEMQFLSSIADPKVNFVVNAAKSSDKGLLVFSQYTTVLEYYREKLADKGISALIYDGKLSMKQRLDVLERWSNGEVSVLLLSVGAARYGLNLTEATMTIFIEPPSSLAVLEQAEDRAWRIGQKEEVVSYLLRTSEIDDDALDNLIKKQAAIDKLDELLKSQSNYVL